MSIAPRLRNFLDESKAEYDVIVHTPTQTALENARSCDIPAEQIAKAVLLDTAGLVVGAVRSGLSREPQQPPADAAPAQPSAAPAPS